MSNEQPTGSEKNPLPDNFLPELKKFLQNETVFGEPYKMDGVTIIPVNSVKVGFAYGGSQKSQTGSGMGGGGVTLTPVAFLIIKNEMVTFQPISTGIEAFIDKIPDFMEKTINLVSKFNQNEKKTPADNPDFSTDTNQSGKE